jgi:hypothetical protein
MAIVSGTHIHEEARLVDRARAQPTPEFIMRTSLAAATPDTVQKAVT